MLDLNLCNNFYVHINIPKSELNVNNLVTVCKNISRLFFQKLFREILLKFQLDVLQRVLGPRWKPKQLKPSPWECPRCGSRYGFKRRGHRKRALKTSYGDVHFKLLQITCFDCGKTFSPFPKLLGIAHGHRLTRELEQLICRIVKDKSYRKTANTFDALIDLNLSPYTVHRVVQKYGRQMKLVEDVYHIRQLQYDSTKINAAANERGLNVHLAVAVGNKTRKHNRVLRKKSLVDVQVSPTPDRLKKQLKTSVIDQLTVDGLSGLQGYIKQNQLDIPVQRCLWHIPKTAVHMLYLEGIPTPMGRQFIRPLKQFIFDEKLSIQQRLAQYDMFTYSLLKNDLFGTARFLENAREYLFTYKQHPEGDSDRTISIVERQMREINRRMENGARWTPQGAENLLKLKFVEELNPQSYDHLWKIKNHLKASYDVILC